MKTIKVKIKNREGLFEVAEIWVLVGSTPMEVDIADIEEIKEYGSHNE